eukprot:3628414-Amphidinium_carterae.1
MADEVSYEKSPGRGAERYSLLPHHRPSSGRLSHWLENPEQVHHHLQLDLRPWDLLRPVRLHSTHILRHLSVPDGSSTASSPL